MLHSVFVIIFVSNFITHQSQSEEVYGNNIKNNLDLLNITYVVLKFQTDRIIEQVVHNMQYR